MKFSGFPNDRQLDMMDCGPACLKMIAKHYNRFYSLQYLRDKCGVTKEGVSFADISYAAEDIGLRTLSIKCTFNDLMFKIPLPVIVHWDNSHFVVVYKTKPKSINTAKAKLISGGVNEMINGNIYVSDPAKGYIKYSANEFAAKWVKEGSDKGILMATCYFKSKHSFDFRLPD